MRAKICTFITILIFLLAALPVSAAPGWWPDEENFVRTHNTLGPRVVDDADIFTDAEEAEMLLAIEKIQSLDIDLVVFTDTTTWGEERGTYAEAFHYFNGYGYGDNFTGTILFICMEEGNRGWWTAATGDVEGMYSYEVINALDDRLYPYMAGGDYGEGVLDYLENVYELYTGGPFWEQLKSEENQYYGPESPDYYPDYDRGYDYETPLFFGLIAGVVVGLISVGAKRREMKPVRVAKTAANYLVPGSFRLWRNRDIYLYSTETRVKRQTESHQSGHGGSSFSGSHSSFGGSHYSGGGRSF